MYHLRRFATAMPRLAQQGAAELVKRLVGPTAHATAPLNPKGKKAYLAPHFGAYNKDRGLKDFQRLCVDLGLPGDLASKNKCRKEIKKLHVNIEQFLKSNEKPGDVKFFKDLGSLVKYMKENKTFVPAQDVPKGNPVKALLKTIWKKK